MRSIPRTLIAQATQETVCSLLEKLEKTIKVETTRHVATYFSWKSNKIVYGGTLLSDYIRGYQDLYLARALDKMNFPKKQLSWSHKAAYVIFHEIAHMLVYEKGLRKKGVSHGTAFYSELKVLLEHWWDCTADEFKQAIVNKKR